MPFTWNQVNTMPDITSANRYKVFFPRIPGVDTQALSILVKSVTIPRKAIGHITVKIMDFSLGFRGGIEFENMLSIRFHENVRGEATRSIQRWMRLARNINGKSELKRTYARDGKLEIYDAIGRPTFYIPLYSMFPLSIEFPELDDSSSQAYEFTVEFNVDMAEPL